MKSLICYFACSLVLLLSISEGCKEIYPSFVNKHFLSNNCGKTIELKYEISKYNYIVVDVNGNGCSIHKNMYHITKSFYYHDSCAISLSVVSDTLSIIASLTEHNLCLEDISVKDCGHAKEKINNKKISIGKRLLQINSNQVNSQQQNEKISISNRWLQINSNRVNSQQQTSKSYSVNELLVGLLSCGLLLTLVASMMTILLSCCNSKPTPSETEAIGLTDSMNSTSPELFKGLHPPPSTPQEVIKAFSPSPVPEYISPRLLNIPDVPPPTPPRNSRTSQIPIENIERCNTANYPSSDKIEHHYQVLEPRPSSQEMQDMEGTTCLDHGTRTDESSRAYFVLDVPKESSIESSTDNPERIYHVLESAAASSESHQCTICSKSLEDEEESIYLVVLPDEVKQKDEPIYHVLDQSSLICPSCLYFENDPIYHEVEAYNDGYAMVKNLIHQASAASDGSHTYSTVPSIDCNDGHLADGCTSLDKSSVKRIFTKDASGDYASIPGSPIHKSLEDLDSTSRYRHNSFSNLLSALKDKLVHQVQQSQDKNKVVSSNPPTKPSIDEDDVKGPAHHHMYENIGPGVDTDTTLAQVQMKLNEMTNAAKSSPMHSLVRSKSHSSDYSPVIIAQRKKSGSYHVLNVEDIWKHQLANRYAPVSIVTRRSSSPVKLRKGTSLKSRKSYIREALASKSTSSDYEEPIKLFTKSAETNAVLPSKPKTRSSEAVIVPINSSIKPHSIHRNVIPPPFVIRSRLPRQDALHSTYCFDETKDNIGEDYNRLYAINSEPCLSLSDDNDHIPKQAISPLKQHPLERSMSSCTSSPVKTPFKENSLLHYSLSYDDDTDYNDLTWN